MFEIDTSLHWTEHFIKYGFAVLRNQVDKEFTTRALERVRHYAQGEGKNLPFDQWTTKNITRGENAPSGSGSPEGNGDPVLDSVFEQPNIRHIIDTMYGTHEIGLPHGWSGKPVYQVFLNPFNPDAKPKKLWGGHIDFGGNIIPLFGNAFVIQVALHDTEPFGGNITVTPGSHKLVQQRAKENPLTQYPYDFDDYPFTEPYEFVAKAGDVFLMHHLCFHTGNPCVGATRKPRIALHCQAERTTYATKADPADPTNSPWLRSFTLNGFIEDPDDEQRYIRFCEAKKSIWGHWTSDDGKTEYKIYTFFNGCLRATIHMADGSKQFSERARFDGKKLTFEQTLPMMVLAGPEPSQNTGALKAKATLEVDAQDKERMTCTLEPLGPGKATQWVLRRTKVITMRQRE